MHLRHQHAHHHKRQFNIPSFANPFDSNGNDPFADVKDKIGSFLPGSSSLGGQNNPPAQQQSQQQPQEQQQQQQQSSPNKRQGDDDDDRATKVSIVFVTAPKTFEGDIGGFTTMGNDDDKPAPTPTPKTTAVQTTKEEPKPTPAPTKDSSSKETPKPTPKTTSSSEAPETTEAPKTKSKSANDDDDEPTTTKTRTKTPITDSIDVSSSETLAAQSSSTGDLAAAASSTNLPSSKSDSSAGMSGGAKAGIAIGVILAILALAGAAFVFYRFKKNKDARAEEALSSEKNPFGDAAAASPPSHMRPITPPTMAASAAPAGTLGGAGAAMANATSARDGQSSNPSNPFGTHAETSSSIMDSPTVPAAAPSSRAVINDAEKAAMSAGAGAAAGGIIGAAVTSREKNARNNRPQLLDVNAAQAGGPFGPALAAQPSPSGSQFSNSSITSAAIAGGAPVTNVHRVQLDFKPSMDDELDLKAGQLVRLLHEYDDGWALCIRMDRSQQGVVPRTCLSGRPVKPRNGPPPMGPPGMRGPPGGQGRNSPGPNNGPRNGPRSQSPALRPNQTQRSMSPGPYGGGPQPQRPGNNQSRPRSNSDTNTERRANKAPGSSPMNPGQAPAVQRSNNGAVDKAGFQLPIQVPRPLTPSGQSTNSATPPVSRKPVPGQS